MNIDKCPLILGGIYQYGAKIEETNSFLLAVY